MAGLLLHLLGGVLDHLLAVLLQLADQLPDLGLLLLGHLHAHLGE
jgi:hypothetical protein